MDLSPDQKADMLDKEADKVDKLISEGDPDAALSVIGGIASALNSNQEDSDQEDSDSQKVQQ